MAKILLVEDDNNLREIYGERLLAEGYVIVSARDGEEALSVAITEKPDLIISDVMMPKISGFDMLDILRQTPETKDVKIIMMTALSQAEDKARADMLGANKYLVKSQVTLEDVARVVHDILEETKPQTPPETPTEVTNQIVAEPTNQPVIATPTDDSSSDQSQQSDDGAQTNNDDAIVTDDNSQASNTDVQTEPNSLTTEEPNIENQQSSTDQALPNNFTDKTITTPIDVVTQEPAQQALDQNQPQETYQDQAPVIESSPQSPPEQIEQTTETFDNPEQTIQEEPPQASIEQPIATEPTPEATYPPTEDLPQPQAQQEPTLREEPLQEASTEPQALPANPIAQNITELPTLEPPQETPEQPIANSGNAEPAADELTEVTNQIEDFINNSVTPISEHQEPLTQPSDANNNTADDKEQTQAPEPLTEQPTEPTTPEAPIETLQEAESPQAETTPEQPTEQAEPAPEVIDATNPNQLGGQAGTSEAPQDNTIPPVIPVESPEGNSDDSTRNPEPASVRKKIISPVHNGDSLGTPDINKLFQEEMAKEAEENSLQNPVANSIVSASTNPISVGSGNAELPQLETIDASQIPGISTDDIGPIGVVSPTTSPEQPIQIDNTGPEPHEDPNNPNNIAL